MVGYTVSGQSRRSSGSARERLGGELEVRVEDRADGVVGAELRAQRAVVADVGLHEAGRDGGTRRRARSTSRRRTAPYAKSAATSAAKAASGRSERPPQRRAQALVAEHDRERETGCAGEIGRLPQRERREAGRGPACRRRVWESPTRLPT